MEWQHDGIRQVPNPNRINKQHISRGQEVPSPQQIPGREIFLERSDLPSQEHMPATQSFATEWIHTRQGFIRLRKSLFQGFIGRFFQAT